MACGVGPRSVTVILAILIVTVEPQQPLDILLLQQTELMELLKGQGLILNSIKDHCSINNQMKLLHDKLSGFGCLDKNLDGDFCNIPLPANHGMPSPDMLHDIAPGKMTYASSVYQDALYPENAFPPESAIDGNDTTMFHSKHEERPWWMIDLGSERVIYHIMILSRQDRFAGRLQDLEIRLGSSKQTTGDFSSYGLLYFFKGPYRQEDGYLMYTFIHGVKGRYLSLQMVKGQPDFLQLKTVKVIALRN